MVFEILIRQFPRAGRLAGSAGVSPARTPLFGVRGAFTETQVGVTKAPFPHSLAHAGETPAFPAGGAQFIAGLNI